MMGALGPGFSEFQVRLVHHALPVLGGPALLEDTPATEQKEWAGHTSDRHPGRGTFQLEVRFAFNVTMVGTLLGDHVQPGTEQKG